MHKQVSIFQRLLSLIVCIGMLISFMPQISLRADAAVDHTGCTVYFDNTKSNWQTDNISLLIGHDTWTEVIPMTKVDEAGNWYKVEMKAWSGATYCAVIGNDGDLWGTGNWGPGNRTNATHYTNVYNDYGFNSGSYYTIVPAGAENNANISLSYVGSSEPCLWVYSVEGSVITVDCAIPTCGKGGTLTLSGINCTDGAAVVEKSENWPAEVIPAIQYQSKATQDGTYENGFVSTQDGWYKAIVTVEGVSVSLEYTFKDRHIALTHTDTGDGEYHTAACANCGYSEVLGHSSSGTNMGTCTTKYVCDYCGVAYGEEPTGHFLSSGTANDDGSTHTGTCLHCGESVTLPHNTERYDGTCGVCDYHPLSEDKNESMYRDIETVEDFLWWAEMIRQGKLLYCELVADIDMAGQPWTPLGTEDAPFVACLYGNGYQIRNLPDSLVGYGDKDENGSGADIREIGFVNFGGDYVIADGVEASVYLCDCYTTDGLLAPAAVVKGGREAYYVADAAVEGAYGEAITREQATGGWLAVKLGLWQNLATEDYPSLSSESEVYQVYNCAEELVGYTNDINAISLGHDYADGICRNGCNDPYLEPVDSDGDGYYEIANTGNLLWCYEYSGVSIYRNLELTADITVSTTVDGEAWDSIPYYGAIFEGNGFTVTINGGKRGLVGVLYEDGTVQNVTVAGTISREGDSSHVGGIVHNNFGTVTNCTNTASVTTNEESAYAGGIAGTNNGTITDCTNKGAVTAAGHGADAGGIAGSNYGTITDCTNEGDVTAAGYGEDAGGIAGTNNGTITDCTNKGAVTAAGSNSYAGGIAGRCYGSVTGCTNSATVSGKDTSGGIVGYTSGRTVKNCVNTAAVSSEDDAGGIVGFAEGGYFVMTGCWNTGTVSAADDAGSLIYYVNGASGEPMTVTNCVALAVEGQELIGDSYGEQVSITNCKAMTQVQFAAGAAAYLLNGNTSETVTWYQTIGTDAYPVLDNTHGVVYAVSGLNCDGTVLSEAYSNDPDAESVKPDHMMGAVSYEWNEDYTQCTATRGCINCTTQSETATTTNITSRVINQPDCEREGTAEHTATFTEAWAGTDTAIQTLDETDHVWGEPTWNWNGVAEAELVLTCQKDSNHTDSVEASIESGELDENGRIVYTATAVYDGKTYTDTKTGTALMVAGVELAMGQYLDTQGNLTTEKPEGGYAYFHSIRENGVIVLVLDHFTAQCQMGVTSMVDLQIYAYGENSFQAAQGGIMSQGTVFINGMTEDAGICVTPADPESGIVLGIYAEGVVAESVDLSVTCAQIGIFGVNTVLTGCDVTVTNSQMGVIGLDLNLDDTQVVVETCGIGIMGVKTNIIGSKVTVDAVYAIRDSGGMPSSLSTYAMGSSPVMGIGSSKLTVVDSELDLTSEENGICIRGEITMTDSTLKVVSEDSSGIVSGGNVTLNNCQTNIDVYENAVEAYYYEEEGASYSYGSNDTFCTFTINGGSFDCYADYSTIYCNGLVIKGEATVNTAGGNYGIWVESFRMDSGVLISTSMNETALGLYSDSFTLGEGLVLRVPQDGYLHKYDNTWFAVCDADGDEAYEVIIATEDAVVHIHKFGDEWQSNEYGHWKEGCVSEDCYAENMVHGAFDNHTFQLDGQTGKLVCGICDYEKEATLFVGDVALAAGEYLAQGGSEPTTQQPADNYAYFYYDEAGQATLVLHNFSLAQAASVRHEETNTDESAEYHYYDSPLVYATMDLTVVVEGENTLENTKPCGNTQKTVDGIQVHETDHTYAVLAEGDLTFTGEGVLRLFVTEPDATDPGYSYVVEADDVTVDMGETGEIYVVGGDNSDGISADQFHLLGGSVYIEAYDDGINSDDTQIDGGCLDISAEYGIYTDDFRITDGEVYIEAGYAGIEGGYGTVEFAGGTVTIDAEEDGLRAEYCELTISGGTVTINAYDGIDVDDSDVNITGGEVEICGEDDAIYVEYGDVNITGGELTVESYYGIYVIDGDMTVTNATVDVTVEYWKAIYVEYGELRISGDKTSVSVMTADEYEAICAEYGIYLENVCVHLPEGGFVDDDVILDADGNSVQAATIASYVDEDADGECDVCGGTVSSGQSGKLYQNYIYIDDGFGDAEWYFDIDLAAEGSSELEQIPYAVYDVDTHTLTIEDMTAYSLEYIHVDISQPLNLVLNGSVSVSELFPDMQTGWACGLYVSGDLNITVGENAVLNTQTGLHPDGNAILIVRNFGIISYASMPTAPELCGIFVGGDLTVNAQVAMASLYPIGMGLHVEGDVLVKDAILMGVGEELGMRILGDLDVQGEYSALMGAYDQAGYPVVMGEDGSYAGILTAADELQFAQILYAEGQGYYIFGGEDQDYVLEDSLELEVGETLTIPEGRGLIVDNYAELYFGHLDCQGELHITKDGYLGLPGDITPAYLTEILPLENSLGTLMVGTRKVYLANGILDNLTAENLPIYIWGNSDYSATLTPDEGYSLPESVTVLMQDPLVIRSGEFTLQSNQDQPQGVITLVADVDYTYDQETGEIIITRKSIVGNVTIQAVALINTTVENKDYDVSYTYGETVAQPKVENFAVNTSGAVSFGWYAADKTTAVTVPVNAGTYYLKVTVAAVSGYTPGEAFFEVTVAPKSVTTLVLSQTSYEYDGKAKEPTVTVKDGSTVIPADEYTVTITNNTAIGTATVTVSDVAGGNYTVSGSATFKIVHTQHQYEAVVTDPTCEEKGYTTHTCSVCDDSYVDSYVDALGHEDQNSDGKCDACGEDLSKPEDPTDPSDPTDPDDRVNPFVDVEEGKYYYDAVLWAAEEGITTGKTATTFEPNEPCTRKQIVTFLWRAAGEPEPESMVNPFTDVKNDRFLKAILWAYYEGVTTGTGDGTTFSPEEPCTRKQIVTFLWRFHGEPEPAKAVNPFVDVKADRFEKAILWAYENGITTGKTATTFQPEAICTRCQIVTFLYRAFAEK